MRIRIRNPGFLGFKYLNSLMRIRDGKIQIRDPEWKEFGSGIRDKHPGSATLTGAWGAAATFFRKSSLFFFHSSFWSCTFFHSSSRGFLPVQ
jgi:hypothetical protein